MRVQALDSIRGILLIIMTVDHSKELIAKNLSFYGEKWGGYYPHYENFYLLLSRIITHICAPGFAFMMGLSMILLWEGNKTKWQKESEIWAYFITRGFVLISFELLLFSPIWSYSYKAPKIFFSFSVIAMLGSIMIICCFFIKRQWPIILFFMCLSFILSPLILPHESQWETQYNLLTTILFIPDGKAFYYPIFPWLGLGLFGILFGKMLLINQKKTFSLMIVLSFIFICLFFISRFLGGTAFNGRPKTTLSDSNWWDFFYMIKYPPSISYLLITMGVFFFIFYTVYFIERFSNKKIFLISSFLKITSVYGKSTFFFYTLHLIILSIIGTVLFDIQKWNSWSDIAYGWLITLIILYPLCKKYREFKKTKNENSIWKML